MFNIIQTKVKPTTIQEWVVVQAMETKQLQEQAKKDAVQ